MRGVAKRFVRGSRGQSLVEFALILPMMLVVMFMITEFGRALYQYNVMTTATREGCRQAVVSSSDRAEAVADSVAQAILTAGHVQIPASDIGFTDIPNYNDTGIHVLKISADKTFDWAFSGPLTMTGGAQVSKPANGLHLHAETIMHVETF